MQWKLQHMWRLLISLDKIAHLAPPRSLAYKHIDSFARSHNLNDFFSNLFGKTTGKGKRCHGREIITDDGALS